ncbi:hypothetical protein L3N51_01383 [Metallosphaera sp. J1]|nr:hypothetical protein [Metallosphaera javensis (ex Hofmann et al. 2022)]
MCSLSPKALTHYIEKPENSVLQGRVAHPMRFTEAQSLRDVLSSTGVKALFKKEKNITTIGTKLKKILVSVKFMDKV